MKLVYRDMEHILCFDDGYVCELIIENKKMFFDVVNNMVLQTEGMHGECVLSVNEKPVDFSKYVDVTVQFAPFQVNKKSLLTKLYSSLERKALIGENYTKTGDLLGRFEKYIFELAEDIPFEISCQKLAIGPIIRAISPEIDETDKSNLEKIFSYMELVREFDRDRLFVMVNMRTYFSDDDMTRFIESVCLHDFKVLLLENFTSSTLKNTKRFTVDEDLCEF